VDTTAVTGRFDLTDAQWAVLEPLLPTAKRPGRSWLWTKRQLIDGMRWRVRVGSGVTARSSCRFWPVSGCPASVVVAPAPGPIGCWPTRHTPPAPTVATCDATGSRQPFPARATKTPTGARKAPPVGGAPPSTPRSTSSATPWNAASTGSNATAPWLPVRQACRALPSHHLHRRDQRMAVIDFDTDHRSTTGSPRRCDGATLAWSVAAGSPMGR
jgi:Putative transposase of IS4/5 family (DUF4096)